MRIIGALLVSLLLAGCSSVKFAYNQAPDLLHLYLDRYFDFNSDQSARVKQELAQLQAWHRQTQLPVYVETLQKLEPQMAADFSSAQACSIYTDMRTKLQSIGRRMEPASAALVVTFGDDQFAQMEKKFSRDNEKFRSEYIDASPREVRAKRLKDAVARAEKLYGSIGEKQLATLSQIIDRSRFDAKVALAERQRRQQDTLATLKKVSSDRSGSQAGSAEPVLRKLFAQAFESTDPRYRSYMGVLTQEACDGFADFHNVTTVDQRNRAAQTLQEYARDFKLLASQSPG